MIKVNIPGFKEIVIKDIVCDYNGTLAVDGKLIDGVREKINQLSNDVNIHVITADTFGLAQSQLAGVNCKLVISPKEKQDQWKLNYMNSLNPHNTLCIGNGRNDRLMLKEAVIGIALIQKEGASAETIMSSNIVCRSIHDALDYLVHPKRLIATLRS